MDEPPLVSAILQPQIYVVIDSETAVLKPSFPQSSRQLPHQQLAAALVQIPPHHDLLVAAPHDYLGTQADPARFDLCPCGHKLMSADTIPFADLHDQPAVVEMDAFEITYTSAESDEGNAQRPDFDAREREYPPDTSHGPRHRDQ